MKVALMISRLLVASPSRPSQSLAVAPTGLPTTAPYRAAQAHLFMPLPLDLTQFLKNFRSSSPCQALLRMKVKTSLGLAIAMSIPFTLLVVPTLRFCGLNAFFVRT
jgi:hypothetical protein